MLVVNGRLKCARFHARSKHGFFTLDNKGKPSLIIPRLIPSERKKERKEIYLQNMRTLYIVITVEYI